MHGEGVEVGARGQGGEFLARGNRGLDTWNTVVGVEWGVCAHGNTFPAVVLSTVNKEAQQLGQRKNFLLSEGAG